MVLPQAMAWVQYWFRVLSLKFCGKSQKNLRWYITGITRFLHVCVHHPLYTYIFRKGHVSKIKNRNFRKKSPPLKIYVSIVNCNICSWVMCGVPLCASISLYAEYSKLWHLTFIAHSDFVLPVNTNIPRYPLSLSLYVFVFSLTFVVVFPWNDWPAT